MEAKETARRVIRATPENAAQMRAFVKRWPELETLVRELQAADRFPGLRCMTVTLYGPQEWVQQGLDVELEGCGLNRHPLADCTSGMSASKGSRI